jgi:hypothetical protein
LLESKKRKIVSRLMKISGLQANVDKLGQLTEEFFGLLQLNYYSLSASETEPL